MTTAPTLRTDRLELSRLRESDAAAIYAYRSLPEVARFQSWEPASEDNVRELIAEATTIPFHHAGTRFQFALRLLATGEVIGDLGIHFPADQPHQAEVGITLAPSAQGQGLATEALRAILDYLFETLKKHRIYASTDPQNHPSHNLLRTVGFRQEAHFRQSLWFKGEWVDDVVFGLLRGEWVGSLA
ncbi:MAG: GNAT family protein [Acidobacteriota bacterium]|nr:GNAT family protein [Acidobacteriota bacterium]